MLSHSMRAGYKEDQLTTISVVFMGWISIRKPSKTTSNLSRKKKPNIQSLDPGQMATSIYLH